MHAKILVILIALSLAGTVACSGSAPDANVCNQLAAAAQAQFESYPPSMSSLACQLDSDCTDLDLQSLNCFAPCGRIVRTADVSTVTTASAKVCDRYFGAGCPAKTPPCALFHAVCDHGSCATASGGGELSGSIDAATDTGTGEVLIDGGGTSDGGDTSDAKDSAPEKASTVVDAAVCTWPASFTPSGDTSTLGCWASSISNPCQLPSGDVVGPEGIILGPDGNPVADQSCRFACLASEYALACIGEYTWPDSGCETRTMPAPDSSLGCRILPIPTTSNSSYYCCPCGQGQASLADASVSVSTLCYE